MAVAYPPEDPIRSYDEAESRRLTEQLARLVERVHRGDFLSREPTLDLLCEFHRELFEGVRGHAGRVRSADQGTDRLIYGPQRSPARAEVPGLLAEAFEKATRSYRSLLENQDDPEYDQSALHLAVWVHVEIVGIHPFEDGNGRASRLFLSYLLVRLGLRPVALEVPRQEYFAVMNRYFGERVVGPLVDLFLRLYVGGLPPNEA